MHSLARLAGLGSLPGPLASTEARLPSVRALVALLQALLPQVSPQRLSLQSEDDSIEEVYVSQESAGEEDPARKDSASEGEVQRHSGQSSRGGPAPPGGRTSRKMRRRAVPSSRSEEDPQA